MLRITHRVHHGQPSDTLELPFDQRTRSRHRVRLASGREAALLLERGMVLHVGDLLATEHGETVRVVSATESLSVVRTDSPESLARAAYHLGNRHVTLQIGEGFVAYPHDHVLDAMVHALGLTVSVEMHKFHPEKGAYAQPHAHSDSRPPHAHSHDEGPHP
jgi:urease accessory protein